LTWKRWTGILLFCCVDNFSLSSGRDRYKKIFIGPMAPLSFVHLISDMNEDDEEDDEEGAPASIPNPILSASSINSRFEVSGQIVNNTMNRAIVDSSASSRFFDVENIDGASDDSLPSLSEIITSLRRDRGTAKISDARIFERLMSLISRI
jgi:hypothetical protein